MASSVKRLLSASLDLVRVPKISIRTASVFLVRGPEPSDHHGSGLGHVTVAYNELQR
jgi:hypothetical protein